MQLVVYLAVEDSTVDMDAKNHQHNLHEKTQQSILEVNRGGTYSHYPISLIVLPISQHNIFFC